MKYSHENTPYGFKPCTRETGHDGACALPEADMVACPDCTNWQMAFGKGGYYKTKWLFGICDFIPIGKEWKKCETCDGSGQIYE